MHLPRILSIVVLVACAYTASPAADNATFDIDHVFAASEVDAPPEIIKTANPAYPVRLAGSGQSGLAAVAVVIDKMGDIEDVRVVKASAPEFEKPAEDCVRYWRFLPGNRKGRNVKVRLVVPIRFNENQAGAT
jgi:TonB family protein